MESEQHRLDQLIADRACRAPEDRAVAADGREVSYRQLETDAARLADRLRAAGLRPGHRVGVHLLKGYASCTAIYAILRAGAVVAPLDRADPPERTAGAVTGAALDFLLTDTAGVEAATRVRERTNPAERSAARDLDPGLHLLPLADRADREAGEDAYILFTSGSTGRPKGVVLTHENMLHFAHWAARALGLTPRDRIGSQASLTFDLSTFDLFATACSGACVVLLDEGLKSFPREVVNWLRQQDISVFYAVPSLYRAMAERGGISAQALPSLRTIAFAGEPFPPELLQWYVGEFHAARFWNLYGPTETNVCTCTEVPPGWKASDGLSIGTAIDGLTVELAGPDGGPTAQDGEIAVAGPSVLRGYLEQGELRDPTVRRRFGDGVVRRAYLTGDLGTLGEHGDIWLKGRADDQVKINGHRIDLGDVESTAGAVAGVHSCAAVVDHGGRLVLYAVTDGLDEHLLRRSLAAALPRKLVPEKIRTISELPLNARGKVDRLLLAAER